MNEFLKLVDKYMGILELDTVPYPFEDWKGILKRIGTDVLNHVGSYTESLYFLMGRC